MLVRQIELSSRSTRRSIQRAPMVKTPYLESVVKQVQGKISSWKLNCSSESDVKLELFDGYTVFLNTLTLFILPRSLPLPHIISLSKKIVLFIRTCTLILTSFSI